MERRGTVMAAGKSSLGVRSASLAEQPAPPPAARHAGLTRLRFLLIGWVVLYHLDLTLGVSAGLSWLKPLLRAGYLGVDGFFLLSGFALWLGYAARPPVGLAGMRHFLLRRMAKIWPLHVLALAALAGVVGLAILAGFQIRDPERFGLGDLLLQLALLNAWETTSRHTWNYPSWALSAEWAGYLAFPFLIQAALRLPRAAVPLVPAVALAGLFWLTGREEGTGLNYTLHLGLVRFGFEFCAGLALGRLATEGRLPPGWVAAATVALPAGLLLGKHALAAAGLAATMLTIWHRGLTRPAPARPDLLLRLGEASFGVYLCWIFIEAAMVAVLRIVQPDLVGRILLMGAGFAASLLAGWLAWRFIEVPAHRWILRRTAR